MYTILSYDTNINQNIKQCHLYDGAKICARSTFISSPPPKFPNFSLGKHYSFSSIYVLLVVLTSAFGLRVGPDCSGAI